MLLDIFSSYDVVVDYLSLFFMLMKVNNVIFIFENCIGCLLLVLMMLHLGQIVKIHLIVTTYHMSKGTFVMNGYKKLSMDMMFVIFKCLE